MNYKPFTAPEKQQVQRFYQCQKLTEQRNYICLTFGINHQDCLQSFQAETQCYTPLVAPLQFNRLNGCLRDNNLKILEKDSTFCQEEKQQLETAIDDFWSSIVHAQSHCPNGLNIQHTGPSEDHSCVSCRSSSCNHCNTNQKKKFDPENERGFDLIPFDSLKVHSNEYSMTDLRCLGKVCCPNSFKKFNDCLLTHKGSLEKDQGCATQLLQMVSCINTKRLAFAAGKGVLQL